MFAVKCKKCGFINEFPAAAGRVEPLPMGETALVLECRKCDKEIMHTLPPAPTSTPMLNHYKSLESWRREVKARTPKKEI